MKHFLKKLTLFLSILLIPFLGILISYLHYDPFKVVKKYSTFYQSGKPRYVALNFDYVAVETFLMNYPTYHYNSFIIGNSRTRFYKMDSWKKYIKSDKCFHFDASNESVFGLWKKMKLLHQKNVKIDNVLIVLDYSTFLAPDNPVGHVFVKHPLLSGQSRFDFHLQFFKAFAALDFMGAYLKNEMAIKPSRSGLLSYTPVEYNLKYNEMYLKTFEDEIKQSPNKFYDNTKLQVFYKRDSVQKFSPSVIKDDQIVMLRKIKNIFKKHNTNYKIIINPLYDQLKFNKKDLEILNKLFEDKNVFNFSGINSFTSDYHNYYENSHYRPFIADSIMRVVYQ